MKMQMKKSQMNLIYKLISHKEDFPPSFTDKLN